MGTYVRRGDLMEGFCITSLGGFYLEGLILGILLYSQAYHSVRVFLYSFVNGMQPH